MIIGYLSEDGKIYDKNGKFVKEYKLERGEMKIEIDEKFYCGGVVKKGGEDAFDRGICTLVRTNKKLLLFRSIKPMEKFSNQPFFPLSILRAIQAKKLNEKGLKEYIEFFLDEIKKTKKRITGARNIQIVSTNEEEYLMVFPKSKNNTLENLFK